MPVPNKGDGARPDPRLIPLLDHLAKLLAAHCRREAEAAAAGAVPELAPPRKEGAA